MGAVRVLQLRRENSTKLGCYVRVLNLVTACVQLAAGLGSLTDVFSLDVASFLVTFFVVLFALLLLCFECRLRVTDNILRPNFGFLYGYRGMATYLLFIGLLDLGMVGHFFGVLAGAMACANACIVALVGACTPRSSTDYPAVLDTKFAPSYGSSSQLEGPITIALAAGTKNAAAVHAVA
ncbi:hypothetical protein BBJ28_00006444 [Nothophytophthora sp. Chile5]|nr:hypothetical protein BBJ28_00006444 [Nothophytophthora sp. Chile5]